MAEGLLRQMAGDVYDVASAGVSPSRVRPEAIEAMREINIDISHHRSKSVDEFTNQKIDYVITVCDNAREQCPILPGETEQIHWSFDDPAAAEGDEVARLGVFRRVRDEINEQLRAFVTSSDKPVEALDGWRETAQYWTKYSATIATMFTPLTEAMIERAGIHEGQTVLDVAGGAGEPSLTIADRVGINGSVMCTDAVEEMVEAARNEANRRGLKNMQFRQCTADSLPFPDNSFDVVVSRLGVMFFLDSVGAMREMLRVVKPGGSLTFAVWYKSDVNPFCYLVSGVMDQHVKAVPDPDAPNAFRFAELGKLAGVMKQAGVTDVRDEIVSFDIEAPLSALEFWTMRSQTSDTLREKLATLPAAEQTQIAAEVQEAVKDFFPANQMKFPAQMLIATGKKPV
jgi:thioredoxin type arsenate reductase